MAEKRRPNFRLRSFISIWILIPEHIYLELLPCLLTEWDHYGKTDPTGVFFFFSVWFLRPKAWESASLSFPPFSFSCSFWRSARKEDAGIKHLNRCITITSMPCLCIAQDTFLPFCCHLKCSHFREYFLRASLFQKSNVEDNHGDDPS